MVFTCFKIVIIPSLRQECTVFCKMPLMNPVLSSWRLMQIHRKWDLNRAACHPYLCGLCTWHGKIMWNCGGVIAGLERCEGQGFCSKELKVTMKTHRVGILGVWAALISTCHIHASHSCLDFHITFCILLEGRKVKSWTGFLYLKKHRCHKHW